MIIYFTATGNTRWAAQQLAMETGDRLVSMAYMIKKGEWRLDLQEGEDIVWAFPVHAWRPPVVVRDFARRVRVVAEGNHKPRHVVLMTCGDDVGEAAEWMEQALAENESLRALAMRGADGQSAPKAEATGVSMLSAYSLRMPNTYVGIVGMNTDKPEVVEQKLEQARKDMAVIAESIKKGAEGMKPQHPSTWPRINSRIIAPLFERCLLSDSRFRTDTSLCNGCGKCARVCPVANISMADGHPVWHHNGKCIACFACYHHCPRKAIGQGYVTKGCGQWVYNQAGA